MKLMLAGAVLIALTPTFACAQDAPRREERVVVMGGPGGPGMEIPEGGLTRDAFLARHTEMFARLDANGDGVVTRDEMHAMAENHEGPDGAWNWTSEDGTVHVVRRETRDGPEGRDRQVVIMRRGGSDTETFDVSDGDGGQRQVFVFRQEGEGGLDADRDGRLSFDEMAAPLRRHFAEMDHDGDGFLSDAERESARFPAPPAPPAPPVRPGR